MFIKSIGIGLVGVMLFVVSAAAANSVLEGVVKDAKGHPIQGVDVRIEAKNGGRLLTTVRTDENGHYILKSLAEGTYRVTLVVSGAMKTSINNTTLEPGETTQLNFDLTQTRTSVTVKKGVHRVWIPAFTGSRLPGRWVEVDDGGAWAGKLAPTTLYGLVAKNFNGQFTAWTSKGDNRSTGNLPVIEFHVARLVWSYHRPSRSSPPRYEDTE